MVRSIVAGGAGFIGSHLCEALLHKGHHVTCVDNLISGRLKNINTVVVAKHRHRFRFLKHDIREPLLLRADYVFNLASPASPPHYQKNAIFTLLTGSEGTLRMLELAQRNKARFIQASTSEVYGDPEVHPQREDYWGSVNPVGVRACYDEAKRYAEALIMEFWRKHRLDTRIIRIFNTYGPRLDPDDGRVVSNFIKQALKNKPLTIYGRGKQTRSFCYVDDMVEAFLKVAFARGKAGKVYNAGNPGEYTMIQTAKLIKALAESKSKIVHKPLPQDDPVKRKPDISRIKKELGWKPKVKFDEGLKNVIAWYAEEELQ